MRWNGLCRWTPEQRKAMGLAGRVKMEREFDRKNRGESVFGRDSSVGG